MKKTGIALLAIGPIAAFFFIASGISSEVRKPTLNPDRVAKPHCAGESAATARPDAACAPEARR